MYGYGAYRTAEMTPPLADCLKRARKEIEDQYEVRVKLVNPKASFADDWNALCEDIFRDRDTATDWDEKAEILRLYGALPEVYSLIRVPIVLWLEAQHAHDTGQHERAWAALVRCNYYLGMCSAHETKKEAAARGGRHSARRKLPLKNMVLDALKSMGDNSHQRKQDVWAALVPMMEAFKPLTDEQIAQQIKASRLRRDTLEVYRDTFDKLGQPGKSGIGATVGARQLLKRWSNGDTDIQRELARVVSGRLDTRAKRSKAGRT